MNSSWFSNAVSGVKTQWSSMIGDLQENCEKPCLVYYPVSKYEPSDGNIGTSVGNMPGGRTSRGVPGAPWSHGSNPLVGGGDSGENNKVPVRTTEVVRTCVFYDERSWYKTSAPISNPEGMAQTFCRRSEMWPLLRCDYVVFDTDISEDYQQKYERASGPQFCGFESQYVIIMWRRLGNG